MKHQTIVAMNYLKRASKAESEVERFLKDFLPKTEWVNKVFAIGGYVRDQYLSLLKNDPSIEAKDLDLIVDMPNGSEKFTHYLFDKLKGQSPIPVSTPRQMGAGYPIWQITFKQDITYKDEVYKTEGAVIEFADPMKESYPDPESRQRKTEPATLEEDIKRRDISVNMLLKDMTTGEVKDLTGISKHDIEQGIIRGHPDVNMDEIFNADPLRLIRIVRFQAKYDWDVPMDVIRSMKRNAERISIVSAERITEELKKIMKLGKLKQAIKFMSTTGILKHVLPEIEALKGAKHSPKYHQEGDVFRHTLMVLQGAQPGVESQIAALLHDVGKPSSTQFVEDEIHSKGHEDVGATMAEAIMQRLKFDNETTAKVKKMVKYHMRPHDLGRASGPKALRKFIRDVGDEMVDSILALARADEIGKIPATNDIPDLIEKINKVRSEPEKVTKKAILDGDEIKEILGLAQGPEIGAVNKWLVELGDDYAEKGETLTKEQAKEELLIQVRYRPVIHRSFKSGKIYPTAFS